MSDPGRRFDFNELLASHRTSSEAYIEFLRVAALSVGTMVVSGG